MAKDIMSDTQIDENLPALAKTATRNAYRRARRVGAVLIRKNGELHRIEVDGRSVFVKKLKPTISIKKGTKISIRADK